MGGAWEVVGISAERSNAWDEVGQMQKGANVWEVCRRCAGDGGNKCRKVKCMGGAWEVVGISAERSNAQEVHEGGAVEDKCTERSNVWEVSAGRCKSMGGAWDDGGDKCRKVKCMQEVRRRCAGGGEV